MLVHCCERRLIFGYTSVVSFLWRFIYFFHNVKICYSCAHIVNPIYSNNSSIWVVNVMLMKNDTLSFLAALNWGCLSHSTHIYQSCSFVSINSDCPVQKRMLYVTCVARCLEIERFFFVRYRHTHAINI